MNFGISDHIYAEYIIFLENVTWLNISLLNFARKNGGIIDKTHARGHFPFLTLEMENWIIEESAKKQ